MNFIYYISKFTYNRLPLFFFRRKYKKLKTYEKEYNTEELNKRLNYYCKKEASFGVPNEAVKIKNYRKTKGTGYYLDLKEFLHYFTPETSFAYRFGDETLVPLSPTLVKARPIEGDNQNSILFKLNKKRHFNWVDDPIPYSQKKDMAVFRGAAYHPLRREFVEKLWDHPLCNIGQTNTPKEDVAWQKEFLSVKEQLQYKFIFSLEGNDVATNLKWIMSSNSLCFMPKPQNETWFMEGLLKPGIHYVEVNPPYNDLEEKINYYLQNQEEALKIIENAKTYVKQFQDQDLEDLLCLKVLERYACLSGQSNVSKFA